VDFKEEVRMNDGKDVIVIGGGIVGLLTSYYLQLSGYDVQVVTEKEVANTASYVNAGYIAASFGHPAPSIESLYNVIKLILSRDSPVKVSLHFLAKNIRPDSWLWLFIKNSQLRQSIDYSKTVRELCFEGARLLTEIIETKGLDVYVGKTGILEVYLREKALEENLRHLQEGGSQVGVKLRHLSPSECLELEPLLSKDITGGILYVADTFVNPEELMIELRDFLERELEVQFMYGKVVGLETDSKKVTRVKVSDGTVLKGSSYVVCNGVGATSLLSGAGINLPLSPGYGYTIITEPTSMRMSRAVVCGELRLATSQTRNGSFRASGYFDLRTEANTVVDERCKTIKDKASLYLPPLRNLKVVEKRYGARPCSPDGLPYVGRIGFDNLYVNVGHCRLGLTTGAATAKILCDILEGRENKFAQVLSPTRLSERPVFKT
jgi:D-amino-acid dehydrogenase